jgi:hypothetical protein
VTGYVIKQHTHIRSKEAKEEAKKGKGKQGREERRKEGR